MLMIVLFSLGQSVISAYWMSGKGHIPTQSTWHCLLMIMRFHSQLELGTYLIRWYFTFYIDRLECGSKCGSKKGGKFKTDRETLFTKLTSAQKSSTKIEKMASSGKTKTFSLSVLLILWSKNGVFSHECVHSIPRKHEVSEGIG